LNEGWKGFFKWLIGVILAVVGFLVWFFNRKPPTATTSVDTINSDADAAVAATAQEIKKDSDQALADRFNSLAKKQEKKG
jgi:hypothetical protein